jgi:hypothetical protein
VPPWELDAREAPTLALAEELLGPWLVGKPHSARGMRASKFERRVLDALTSAGVDPERVVREVVLPVGADRGVRRFLDDASAGSFQRARSVPLRLDLAWAAGDRLMVIEVDGDQHGKRDHFFLAQTSVASRALRRDALKDSLLRAAGERLCFLRIGPEFQRDTHASRTGLLARLVAFLRPEYAATLFPAEEGGPASASPNRAEEALRLAQTPTIPPAPLPDREWCAAARARSISRRRKRSASSPSSLPRPVVPLSLRRAAEEEALRKVRTGYIRDCRERARTEQGLDPETRSRRLDAIRRRQVASDSRKRPRDDSFHPYDLRWHRLAYAAKSAMSV